MGHLLVVGLEFDQSIVDPTLCKALGVVEAGRVVAPMPTGTIRARQVSDPAWRWALLLAVPPGAARCGGGR